MFETKIGSSSPSKRLRDQGSTKRGRVSALGIAHPICTTDQCPNVQVFQPLLLGPWSVAYISYMGDKKPSTYRLMFVGEGAANTRQACLVMLGPTSVLMV